MYPFNSVALDDAEIAEYLADSIESQFSHASPPHDILHIHRIKEELRHKDSFKPKDDLPPVSLSEVETLIKYLKIRKASGLDGISNKAIKCFSLPLLSLLVAILNACFKNCYFPPFWKEVERTINELGRWFRTWRIEVNPDKSAAIQFKYNKRRSRKIVDVDTAHLRMLNANIPWQFNYKYLGVPLDRNLHFKDHIDDHLLGKGLIIDEQFDFRPAHSCPQQVLRLVEYVSEGFETERSTVAVFFDVAKAFDRQTDISHLGMSALTRQDVLEQEFLKAPPSLLCCTPRTQTIYRDRRRLASNSRYSRTIPRFYGSRNRNTRFTLLPSREPLTSWDNGSGKGG
ncbi:hypothetical protein EVAR_45674_1 [Eumeta japonica]|uniref:RNA-directed DNA polymerase from transposon BS n=1 Tax=Eumeta variegata TaxID=151549 RepID=A0A4C1XLY2_EUMVA|nr:hypothetical protein EVAR_45674_1 [Eumeta japonica]